MDAHGEEYGLILERAVQVLDLIDGGLVGEAVRQIEEMEEQFSGSKSTSLVLDLLRLRLPDVGKSSPKGAVTGQRNPQRANREFAKFQLLLKENRMEEAIETIESAHRGDPENQQISRTLATILKEEGLKLYSRGELEKAIAHWKRVLEIRPGDAETRAYIGRAEFVQRRGDR